mgnify:CR=1 FL=1
MKIIKYAAIDIGSNDGTLLEGFKNQGFKVLGVEPTNIAKLANKKGIKTIQKFFDNKTAYYLYNFIYPCSPLLPERTLIIT